jgi:hypothetical protein
MDRFTSIDDAAVIVYSGGVFRQSKVFRRGLALYCQHGAGFVRLYADHVTGVPKLRWEEIEVEGVSTAALKPDPHGKLSLPGNFLQIESAARK